MTPSDPQSLPQIGNSSVDILARIDSLAAPIAEREGCKLYDVEFSGGGGGRVLRVFIDKAIEGGAGLEDCANISRALNLILDVEDFIPGRYILEVSTPGVDRPLRKLWHFESVVGKKIWVKLNQNLQALGYGSLPEAGHKQFTEILKSAGEAGLKFDLSGNEICIGLEAVERAKVVFEYGTNKPGKPGQKDLSPKKKNKKK
jgi:ribosome maturation factor RimP